MRRKIWKWVFSIFIVAVLIGLSIFLVLSNKNSEEEDPKPETDPEQVFITAFSLNIPSTIYILENTEVHLLPGYISVTPSTAISMVTYDITPKSSGVLGGIEFENDIIRAKSVGNYTIKFTFPKTSTSNFTKNLNIIVYNDQAVSHIRQTENSVYVDESLNLSDVFSINSQLPFEIMTDSKTTISNNILKGINEGESNITFEFKDNFVKYVYKFALNIVEQPEYQIKLIDVENNSIEVEMDIEPFLHIEYKVVNRDQQYVYREVDAISLDESIVRIVRTDDIYVKIEAISKGSTKIIISYSVDPSIKIEVNVIVK